MKLAAFIFFSAVGTTAAAEVSFDDEASLCLLQKVAAVKPMWHSVDLNPAPEHFLYLDVVAQAQENEKLSLASASVSVKPEVSGTVRAEWHSAALNPAPEHAGFLEANLGNPAVALSSASTAVRPQDSPENAAVSLASGSIDVNIQDAASSAALSEDGYSAVAAMGNRELMRAYVRRVAKDEGLRITNEGALSGALAYYSGECSTQSYAALLRELYRGTETAKCKQAWVQQVKPSSLLQTSSHPHVSDSRRKMRLDASSGTEKDEPDSTWRWAADLEDSLGALESELMNLKTAVLDNEETELLKLNAVEADSIHSEQEITLDQTGYEQLAQNGNSTAMALFARRVADREGLKVTNAKPLAGMSRYYSGECATQSFEALVSELHRVVGRKNGRCGGGPWLIEK